MELLGSRQSPTPWPVKTHPEPGRLPSPPVLLSGESQRYYAPLRHPTRLPGLAEMRAATSRRVGLPVLRSALCRRATPPTPVSDRPFLGRFLRRDPAAFPVLMAGRRSRFPFEACAGFTRVAAHRLADPPSVGPCPESFDESVALLVVSVATGVHRQLPGPDSHRLEHSTFHGAHEKGPAARRRPMAGSARRPRVGGVRGHVWAPQTKVRRPDCLARYVARRSRAPYLRRWALLFALADVRVSSE